MLRYIINQLDSIENIQFLILFKSIIVIKQFIFESIIENL